MTLFHISDFLNHREKKTHTIKCNRFYILEITLKFKLELLSTMSPDSYALLLFFLNIYSEEKYGIQFLVVCKFLLEFIKMEQYWFFLFQFKLPVWLRMAIN